MTLTPYVIRSFGGMNLTTDPFEVGAAGAVSTSNVALDIPGQVRTRSGYYKIATTATAPYRVHAYYNAGVLRYITSSTSKLEAFDSLGTPIASVAASGPHSLVTYGGTAISPVVYATSVFDASVRKFNGAAWSTVATATQARAITQDTDSARLVFAGESGGSRVRFSDAGAPETFTSTSYVDVEPGDGDYVTAAVCWQGDVYVFKQSRFFVFYGEDTDASGNPVFRYRTVEGVGARSTNTTVGACASPLGVFFIGPDGVYLTSGGLPVLVSQPLRSLFIGPSPLALTAVHSISWNNGRLILVIGSASAQRVFVWYQSTNAWVEWSAMLSGKSGGDFAGHPELGDRIPFVNATDLALYAMTPACTTDGESPNGGSTDGAGSGGTAIAWSYQTGRYQPGNGNETILPEHSVIGSGTVTVALDGDQYATQTATATLGTAPAVAEGWPTPLDQQGTWLQTTLSGSGPAAVTEVRHQVSLVRQASNAR